MGGRSDPRRLIALVCALIFLDVALWLAAIPLLPRWERELGLTKGQSGVVLGAYSFSVLVFSLPLGRIADRVGAKRLTIAGGVLFALAAPALAFANGFWELVGIRVAEGIFGAAIWTAGTAWVVAAAPRGRSARPLALVNAAATAGSFAGPALGGPLVTGIGIAPVLVGFGVVVAAVLAGVALQPDAVAARETQRPVRRELQLGSRSGKVRASFAAILFASIAGGTLQVLAPLHLSAAGLTDAAVGWIFTATAVVSLAATLVLSRVGDRIDRLRTMAGAAAATGTGHLVLAVGLAVPVYAATVLLLPIATAPLFVFSYALCALGAEEAGAGSGLLIGLLNTIWAGGSLAAPIVAGGLAGAAGDALPFALVAGLSLVAAATLAHTRRRDLFVREPA